VVLPLGDLTVCFRTGVVQNNSHRDFVPKLLLNEGVEKTSVHRFVLFYVQFYFKENVAEKNNKNTSVGW